MFVQIIFTNYELQRWLERNKEVADVIKVSEVYQEHIISNVHNWSIRNALFEMSYFFIDQLPIEELEVDATRTKQFTGNFDKMLTKQPSTK